MALDTHVKDCVCAHYMEKCAYKRHEIMRGAKCETNNHYLFQIWKDDYPQVLYLTESQKKKKTHTHTHKNI